MEYNTPRPTPFNTPRSESINDKLPRGSRERGQGIPLHDTVNALPQLTWDGLNMNDLIIEQDQAKKRAEEGDFAGARVMFIGAIDGLDALMGPAHQSTINALDSFISFCLEQDFIDDAEQKLKESLTKHQEKCGNQDARTLRSIARLGRFYRMQNRYGESELLLTMAKAGFEIIYSAEPERKLTNIFRITRDLVILLRSQQDFARAEQELLDMIAQMEAMGQTYKWPSSVLKMDLVDLYFDDNWVKLVNSQAFVPMLPYLKREYILLELADDAEHSLKLSGNDVMHFIFLIHHYTQVMELEKIEPLLERILKLLDFDSGFRFQDNYHTQLQIFGLQWCMFCSYSWLGKKEAAAKYFKLVQDKIEKGHGPESRDALDCLAAAAGTYFFYELPEEAEALFQELQLRAETLLQPDDTLMSSIMKAFEERKKIWQRWNYLQWIDERIDAGILKEQDTSSDDGTYHG
jgi:hypothetical protein